MHDVAAQSGTDLACITLDRKGSKYTQESKVEKYYLLRGKADNDRVSCGAASRQWFLADAGWLRLESDFKLPNFWS